MATYKVLQDIEAEDKLLGPLTLKQFIFALITIACGYVSFLALTSGWGILTIFLVPPMVVFGFLAWPWSREQPTEIWLLAKLRFMVKPRKRIWDQNGLKDPVTITAPVLEAKNYTDGLSEGEVRSRLQALAHTIDSRGWAIKNVSVNLSAPPAFAGPSDRLIDPNSLPREITGTEVSDSDDILDERNNPTAQNLDRMINETSAAHRQQLMDRMRQPAETAAPSGQPADYWFMNQPSAPIPAGQAMFDGAVTVQPGSESGGVPAADPSAQAQLQNAQATSGVAYSNMRTLQPLDDTQPATPAPSSKTSDPAILELANNDDLNVATIARQANKNKAQDLGDDEVVISLH